MINAEYGNGALNGRLTALFLAGIALAVAVSYGQLARYFFAQDDFILLYKAACDPRGAVLGFFTDSPGQFRPLSKGIYFSAAFRVFGSNATPYHVVALGVHVANMVLTFRLLRRWRVSPPGAFFATTLLALSSANFHVLAWIACIQQLMAMTFVLLSLTWGLDAIRRGTGGAWASAVAYTLALLCFEEALATPFVLAASIVALFPDYKRGLFRATWPHWIVFSVYALFMLLWKGLPESGVYAMAFGVHVARNLATFAAWSLHYFTVLPGVFESGEWALQKSHLLLGTVVVYHVVRRRLRETALGLGLFIMMILPAALLQRHAYHIHVYIPALGIGYLVALAAGDLFMMPPLRSRDRVRGGLGIALVVLTACAYYFSRANERAVAEWSAPFRSSFVVRRAVIAENMWRSIERAKSPDPDEVVMVYTRTQFAREDRQSWNNDNVIGAIGGEAGIKLLYRRCDLEVRFARLGDEVASGENERADVFYYDDTGACRIQRRAK